MRDFELRSILHHIKTWLFQEAFPSCALLAAVRRDVHVQQHIVERYSRTCPVRLAAGSIHSVSSAPLGLLRCERPERMVEEQIKVTSIWSETVHSFVARCLLALLAYAYEENGSKVQCRIRKTKKDLKVFLFIC